MTPAAVNSWIVGLGGRRYLLTIGASAIHSLIFVATDKLSEGGYLTMMGMTIGAYLTANTMQKLQEIRSV
jgi:hypothetical protein